MCLRQCDGRQVYELFLYTRRALCFVGHAPSHNRSPSRRRRLYTMHPTLLCDTDRVIYNATEEKGWRRDRRKVSRGVSRKDDAHYLRTDRSLNCFVASSRRNSPVLHFSPRSVQVLHVHAAETILSCIYSRHTRCLTPIAVSLTLASSIRGSKWKHGHETPHNFSRRVEQRASKRWKRDA